MRFKTKDLLVTVLPKAGISEQEIAKVCLLHTCICKYPTICISPSLCHRPSLCGPCSWLISCLCTFHGTFGCGIANSCGAGGSACDPTIFCAGASREPWVIEDLEDLATVRRELQDTLKQLDTIEKEGGLGAVRTRAEADALEASLTEALEQVRAQKKNLK